MCAFVSKILIKEFLSLYFPFQLPVWLPLHVERIYGLVHNVSQFINGIFGSLLFIHFHCRSCNVQNCLVVVVAFSAPRSLCLSVCEWVSAFSLLLFLSTHVYFYGECVRVPAVTTFFGVMHCKHTHANKIKRKKPTKGKYTHHTPTITFIFILPFFSLVLWVQWAFLCPSARIAFYPWLKIDQGKHTEYQCIAKMKWNKWKKLQQQRQRCSYKK